MIISIPFSSNREVNKSNDQDYNAASPEVSEMQSLLVKIETEQGLIGWGESFGHLINPVTFSALKKVVAPFFINQSFSTVDELKSLIHQAEKSLHGFGRTGPIRYAISAIDIALWDLLSKANQLPLWKFLGGTRQKIELYPSLVNYGDNIQGLNKTLQQVIEAGYREIKVHETKISTIKLIREILPDDVDLSVDLNCIWNIDEASVHFDELKDLHLKWIEEPLWSPDNLAGLSKLREKGIPIAAGENANGEIDFLNFQKYHAVDIFQPSVTKIGGITAILHLLDLAKESEIQIIPHCFYYGAGMLATAHIISMLNEDIKLEVPFIKFKSNVHPILNYKKEINLTDVPGLGFDPDLEIINKNIIKYYSCV
ncbi:mandelate racemase/muconate lactonizing enzyme family protein [Celerinatantimonas sp. YJH-8]|uniref:mandelate racemase/muconate lactonizing enzyme family protein n=1 Tax=Celerinatantimonas sp. YJH-8 TaxID=3228714 RepID=UPI0038C9B09D